MATKRSLAVVILVAALVSIAALSAAHAGNTASEPTYIVEPLPNGRLRVRVQVDLTDRVARDRYSSQQRAEALALAHSGIGSIPMQITFTHPLSVEDLRLWAQRTGLAAELVIFEARDANQKQHTVAARGIGVDIVDLDNLAPGLDARDLHLVGVTAMRGTVPTSELEQLATDPRVYIPDVMPYRVAIEVAARFDVDVDKVEVSVPTPHWYISSERRNAQPPS